MLKGIKLYNHIKKEEKKSKAWEFWLNIRSTMTEDNYMSFGEFWDQLNGRVDRTPSEDILEHAYDIRRRAAKR
jgi:hypothetical protein